MAEGVDVLFINPGDRKQIYQDLGNDYAAIEPPVFAGLFATYMRGKGKTVAIYDAPAMSASATEAARTATEDYSPKLIVIVCYGLQPSASTQNMTAAGDIARLISEAGTDVKVMMTGTHPAALPELTMKKEAIDFVCDLEGPVTILKTLQAIEIQSNNFTSIPSLWSRDGDKIVPPLSAEPLLIDLAPNQPWRKPRY